MDQNGETPNYYLEKLILQLDSQTQCFLFDVQLLWSYDYSKWAIYTKNRILQWKISNFGGVKWGLKIFSPNYQKAHPYAKSGRTNRLAYVTVTFWHYYTAARKKVRENRHWKLDVVYNTTSLPRLRDDCPFM